MDNYHVLAKTAPMLPDDHLVVVHWENNIITHEFREGFAHPEWIHDYGEFMRHLCRSGILQMTPELAEEEPDWDMGWVSVPKKFMPLQTFGVRRDRIDGRDQYTFFSRDDMLDPDVVDEMMGWHIPRTGGLIRYKEGVYESLGDPRRR